MHTCPRCRTGLTSSSYEGVRLETCPQCHGQWLGREELKEIVDTRDKTWSPEALDAGKRASVRGVKLDAVREDLPCPSCGQAMEAFNYGGDSGIILDKCRHCGGIWLDGGELDKVQIAVEASDRGLADDFKRLSGRLREIELQEDLREQRETNLSRAPLVSAIANQILDVE